MEIKNYVREGVGCGVQELTPYREETEVGEWRGGLNLQSHQLLDWGNNGS